MNYKAGVTRSGSIADGQAFVEILDLVNSFSGFFGTTSFFREKSTLQPFFQECQAF
jgi:hypothetical protein